MEDWESGEILKKKKKKAKQKKNICLEHSTSKYSEGILRQAQGLLAPQRFFAKNCELLLGFCHLSHDNAVLSARKY